MIVPGVLRVYKRRTANNALDFIDVVLEEMPFSVQRIQTGRSGEFFALAVQQRLRVYGIKFRPIKPGFAHLSGKIKRFQKTDKIEFYAAIDFSIQNFGLGFIAYRMAALQYRPKKERIQEWNYCLDMQIKKLQAFAQEVESCHMLDDFHCVSLPQPAIASITKAIFEIYKLQPRL
jgi:transposase InsO family protein